jgi:hypothetical protein
VPRGDVVTNPDCPAFTLVRLHGLASTVSRVHFVPSCVQGFHMIVMLLKVKR